MAMQPTHKIYVCLRTDIINAVLNQDEDGIGYHEVKELAVDTLPVDSVKIATAITEAYNKVAEVIYYYFLADDYEGYIITDYPQKLIEKNVA